MRTFKVFVSGADYVSVLLKEKMTLRELREYVCVKKRIQPEMYGFLYTKDVDEYRFNFLSLDMTCGEIPDKEIVEGLHLTNRSKLF